MLVTFKARDVGDIMMFGDVAQCMLEIMGKEPGGQGIVTVEQLPEALTRLKQAVEADRARGRAEPADKEKEEAAKATVSLAQRAVPLIELLERALKHAVPVTWGV